MNFAEYLKSTSSRVDDELECILDSKSRVPDILRRACRYAVIGGGKRLRPSMLLYANQMFVPHEAALRAACAVELVHCYSLVHDDLPAMDDDDMRRGKPSVHKAFDEATAILTGDALLTLAFDLMAGLTELGTPPELALRAVGELSDAAGWHGMVAGQVLDMTTRPGSCEARVVEIHDNKTGMLFIASLRIGASLGRSDEKSLVALTEFGRQFGRLYQVADDIADFGDPGQESIRATYPSAVGIEKALDYVLALEQKCHACLQMFDERGWWLRQLASEVARKVVVS